jgi:hypothetical protein
MSENEDRGYYRMSSYAFHQDAGPTPWVNLRWVRDVIEQFEAGGRSLRDIGSEPEQVAAVRQAAQAADEAYQRRGSR